MNRRETLRHAPQRVAEHDPLDYEDFDPAVIPAVPFDDDMRLDICSLLSLLTR
jgi:hypothetical protein